MLLPTSDIDTSDTPVIREDSVRASNVPYLLNRPDLLANLGGSQALDWVFQAIVYGSDGIAIEHLGTGDSNELVSEAISKLTGSYKAVEYSTDCRWKASGDLAATPIQAVLTDPNNTKVVQNAASTHVLVGLLGTLLLCAALASFLMDTRRLVPFEPGSIMAVGSLLANSNIIRDSLLPEQAEWMTEGELKQALRGFVFGVRYPHELSLEQKTPRSRRNGNGPLVGGDAFTIVAIPQDEEEMRTTNSPDGTDPEQSRSGTSETTAPASSTPNNSPSIHPVLREPLPQALALSMESGDHTPDNNVAVSPEAGLDAEEEPQSPISTLSVTEEPNDDAIVPANGSGVEEAIHTTEPHHTEPKELAEDSKTVASSTTINWDDCDGHRITASASSESQHALDLFQSSQPQKHAVDEQSEQHEQQSEEATTSTIGSENAEQISAPGKRENAHQDQAGSFEGGARQQHLDRPEARS